MERKTRYTGPGALAARARCAARVADALIAAFAALLAHAFLSVLAASQPGHGHPNDGQLIP